MGRTRIRAPRPPTLVGTARLDLPLLDPQVARDSRARGDAGELTSFSHSSTVSARLGTTPSGVGD